MVMPTQETSESTRLQSPNTNDGSAEKKMMLTTLQKKQNGPQRHFHSIFVAIVVFSVPLSLSLMLFAIEK